MIKYITNISLILSLAACSSSVVVFTPDKHKDTAKAAFSTQMDDDAALLMEVDCKKYQISKEVIEDREPKEAAKKLQSIPAGKPLTFYYQNMEIGEPVKEPVSISGYGYRVELKEKPASEDCEASITFIPEKNKNYEIFYGATKDNECHIFAYEMTNSLKAKKKKFKKIKLLPRPSC
ncbi:MAG: hypothetical protein OEY00_08120 [Gammaproteobacteria bacterium]|nr:hypothetical protein [Gammaproteobacteria bacterium]